MDKDDFKALVKRAEQGSVEARSELKDFMRSTPETWKPFGDLTSHVKRMFLDLMVGGNPVASESLQIELDDLSRQLLSGEGSTIRRLAVDQVLLAWLDVHYQQMMSADPQDSQSHTEFLDRRLEKSRKRYALALESLARIDELVGGAESADG